MGSKDDDDDHARKFGARHKIMISAIISLFAVVMIILFLQFYLRYLRKRRRESRTGLETTQQIARTDREDYRAEPPKVGLDPLVIATVLPESIHKQADHHGEVVECSICLSNIEEKATVRLLPNCKHIFHLECIDMWLHSNTTCPICRTAAEPIVLPAEHSDLRPEAQPTAPPLEERTSSRLSSFTRTLSRESSRPVQPTAPPLMEEQSSTRLGSFRRMLSREGSLRVQSCGDGSVGFADIERQ